MRHGGNAMNTLLSLPVPLQTVLLLVASNVFMTFAWYGHLKTPLTSPWYVAALVSWGLRCLNTSCRFRKEPHWFHTV